MSCELARGSNFEHLRSALGALALGCGATVLHRDLDGVFDLTFRLTLDAIGFCCHLRILQARCSCGRPYSGAPPSLLGLDEKVCPSCLP